MSAKKSYIKIWVFLLMVIAFIGIDGMAVVHAQETGQTTQEVLKASSPEDMVQIADALHATWDADSGQLILQQYQKDNDSILCRSDSEESVSRL